MILTFAPTQLKAEVKQLEMHRQSTHTASAGDKVGFCINLSNMDDAELKRGYVASNCREEPANETHSFVAQVVILSHSGKIREGYSPMINCHTSNVACKFKRLISLIDKLKKEVVT